LTIAIIGQHIDRVIRMSASFSVTAVR